MKVRDYTANDETGWVRCRVLSFLNTAYYDNVLTRKEKYDNPSIELVAEYGGEIVGLLDIEYEEQERTVCSKGTGLGGMIWHIAVHPDYYRSGIGTALLKEAESRAQKLQLNRLEAWTRDDEWVQHWYENSGFEQTDAYYHVYLEGKLLNEIMTTTIPHLQPISSFAQYTGENIEQFNESNARVHTCVCYEKKFTI